MSLDNLEPCLDHKGKVVSHGDRFFPLGSDPCTQCTCLNGKPEMCIAVFCSPPENCRQYHALSDKCCEFVCLDRDFPNRAPGNGTYPGKDDADALSTTNLGLRLVASTVTSFLILALLLFMIHRLRQRRLLLMIRRFHARRMDNGNAHLSRRYSEDDDGSVGYFVGHDQLDFSRYDEPPPPYTLWKPPEMYIPPGEAPPPYDLSVQLTAPYASNGRFTYTPGGQIGISQQAVISVHAEIQPVSSHVVTSAASATTSTVQSEVEQRPNCSISTTAEIEINNSVNANSTAVLPPDTQYEESCSYMSNNVQCCNPSERVVENADLQENDTANAITANANNPCDDSAIPTTSSCTCTLTARKGKSYKRHSCSEFSEQNRTRLNSGSGPDKRYSTNPAVSQENNNLYPDPTAWSGEVSESSSSSSPTYDQPTLSPSTSDTSSADADFHRDRHAEPVINGSIPCHSVTNRTSVASHDIPFDNSRCCDLADDSSKQHFHKTLSNLKKFSLIKRKKKKRRIERPNEISCSFVCQSLTDNLNPSQQAVFEDGIDLTSRNSAENISRPLEAINPHIGHKLASSGIKSQVRPTSIHIPGHPHRQHSRRNDGAGPSYISYGDSSATVMTVSGSAAACCTASSPDSICEENAAAQLNSHTVQSSGILSRKGISRSGSICSETGERRHHRSAGSSPTGTLHSGQALESFKHGDNSVSHYASSSLIMGSDRTANERNIFHRQDHGDTVTRQIPVWIMNSVAVGSRHEYDTPSVQLPSMRRSASGSFGESSHSVGDVSSPLDFRDSMLSSGSSWEACSHL